MAAGITKPVGFGNLLFPEAVPCEGPQRAGGDGKDHLPRWDCSIPISPASK